MPRECDLGYFQTVLIRHQILANDTPTSFERLYYDIQRVDKSLSIYNVDNIPTEIKWPPFRRRLFQMYFSNENIWISINISLKFVPSGRIKNIPALVPILAWRRLGNKPLSEPMIVSLLIHICITRPQWANTYRIWLISVHWHTCSSLNNMSFPLIQYQAISYTNSGLSFISKTQIPYFVGISKTHMVVRSVTSIWWYSKDK